MQEKKKINKLINVIGAGLILGSALFTFNFIYNKYKDKQVTEQIIEEVFPDEEVISNDNITQEQTEVSNNKTDNIRLTDNYLGYIEFPNYNIKRLIKTGTDKNILDKGFVGTLSVSANLDDEFGNIILAGHSTKNIFQKLHYMKVNDEIRIVTHTNTYIYQITEKHIINETDMSYFKKINDKKILTLVTCKNNGYQRLIVVAELRGIK